jgi:hypothetical protein
MSETYTREDGKSYVISGEYGDAKVTFTANGKSKTWNLRQPVSVLRSAIKEIGFQLVK